MKGFKLHFKSGLYQNAVLHINVGFDNLYAVVFRKLCQHLLLACYGIALPVNVSVGNR
ncbi:hypothetical protein AALA79_01245 [Lachnospiraceae bacterium 64-25]